MNAIETKILNILVGVDDTAAAVLFDEPSDLTISTRCGMALLDKAGVIQDPSIAAVHGIEEKFLVALADGLNAVQKNHCYWAILYDMNKAQGMMDKLSPYLAAAKGITDALPPPDPLPDHPVAPAESVSGGEAAVVPPTPPAP